MNTLASRGICSILKSLNPGWSGSLWTQISLCCVPYMFILWVSWIPHSIPSSTRYVWAGKWALPVVQSHMHQIPLQGRQRGHRAVLSSCISIPDLAEQMGTLLSEGKTLREISHPSGFLELVALASECLWNQLVVSGLGLFRCQISVVQDNVNSNTIPVMVKFFKITIENSHLRHL